VLCYDFPVISSKHCDQLPAAMRLRSVLETEFARRKQINPRYSLRAFARSVGLDHSTISQLMRGKRAITRKSVRSIGSSLRWNGAAVLKVSGSAAFRFDSRVVAQNLGLSVDEVNVALTDLCLFRLIELKGE
jgi:transcriptional regulator with XRE-family HTH domain